MTKRKSRELTNLNYLRKDHYKDQNGNQEKINAYKWLYKAKCKQACVVTRTGIENASTHFLIFANLQQMA